MTHLRMPAWPEEWPDRDTLALAMQIGSENWVLQLKPEELIGYIQMAIDHHRDRIEWWESERDTTIEQLREKGIEVRERQVTGMERHELVGDPELVKRLGECDSKIRTHTDKRDLFEQWKAVVSLHPADRQLSLSTRDAIFFEMGRHGTIELEITPE